MREFGGAEACSRVHRVLGVGGGSQDSCAEERIADLPGAAIVLLALLSHEKGGRLPFLTDIRYFPYSMYALCAADERATVAPCAEPCGFTKSTLPYWSAAVAGRVLYPQPSRRSRQTIASPLSH